MNVCPQQQNSSGRFLKQKKLSPISKNRYACLILCMPCFDTTSVGSCQGTAITDACPVPFNVAPQCSDDWAGGSWSSHKVPKRCCCCCCFVFCCLKNPLVTKLLFPKKTILVSNEYFAFCKIGQIASLVPNFNWEMAHPHGCY